MLTRLKSFNLQNIIGIEPVLVWKSLKNSELLLQYKKDKMYVPLVLILSISLKLLVFVLIINVLFLISSYIKTFILIYLVNK